MCVVKGLAEMTSISGAQRQTWEWKWSLKTQLWKLGLKMFLADNLWIRQDFIITETLSAISNTWFLPGSLSRQFSYFLLRAHCPRAKGMCLRTSRHRGRGCSKTLIVFSLRILIDCIASIASISKYKQV